MIKFDIIFGDPSDRFLTGFHCSLGEALSEDFVCFDDTGNLIPTDECTIIRLSANINDSLGVEIFDGDIVEESFSWGIDGERYDKAIGIIRNLPTGFFIEYKSFNGQGVLCEHKPTVFDENKKNQYGRWLVVIGNIWETPELLEGDKNE